MTLVLSSGIRKNGATRVYMPRPLRLVETLPRLTAPADEALLCRGFNRPWMSAQSVQQVLRLWAACPSDTEAHQVVCRVILGVQYGLIEVVENA